MTKLKKENFKSILLVLLIITSAIQMGIHWGQQAQGFPFPFIAQIFKSEDKLPDLDIDTLKYQYFVPEAITIGPDTPRWKLDQKDSYFESIWNDMKENYLPVMIKQKPEKVMSKDLWSEITSALCIQIEFNVNWPSELILPLTQKNSGNYRSFDSIKSIAILPQADVNDTVNTVYVYDESRVYQYQVNIENDFLPKAFYEKIVNELSAQNKPGLSVLSEVTSFESNGDILVSLNRGQGIAFPTLKMEIPSSIVLNMQNIENESIQDKILLNQKDSLIAEYNESSGEAIFTDTENLYKLYDNGILDYKYLPAANSAAGQVSAAFSQILNFIELRRGIMGNTEIVLTGIKKTDSYYEMHFGYQFDGVKVYYKDNNSEDKIASPLIIKANSDRVLECRWVIRTISEVEEPKNYSVYFADLINKKIPSLYPEIFQKEKIFFERIDPGYVFGSDMQDNLPITPNWIISTDTKDYFISLSEEGG